MTSNEKLSLVIPFLEYLIVPTFPTDTCYSIISSLDKKKLRFPACPAYQNMTFPCISYMYLSEDRAEIHANIMKRVEKLALSYRFPTCTKSSFLLVKDTGSYVVCCST